MEPARNIRMGIMIINSFLNDNQEPCRMPSNVELGCDKAEVEKPVDKPKAAPAKVQRKSHPSGELTT